MWQSYRRVMFGFEKIWKRGFLHQRAILGMSAFPRDARAVLWHDYGESSFPSR